MKDAYTLRQIIKMLLDFETHKDMIIDGRHYLILKNDDFIGGSDSNGNIYDLGGGQVCFPFTE